MTYLDKSWVEENITIDVNKYYLRENKIYEVIKRHFLLDYEKREKRR